MLVSIDQPKPEASSTETHAPWRSEYGRQKEWLNLSSGRRAACLRGGKKTSGLSMIHWGLPSLGVCVAPAIESFNNVVYEEALGRRRCFVPVTCCRWLDPETNRLTVFKSAFDGNPFLWRGFWDWWIGPECDEPCPVFALLSIPHKLAGAAMPQEVPALADISDATNPTWLSDCRVERRVQKATCLRFASSVVCSQPTETDALGGHNQGTPSILQSQHAGWATSLRESG